MWLLINSCQFVYTKIFITRGEILKISPTVKFFCFICLVFTPENRKMKDLLDIEIHPKNYQKGKYDLIFVMTVDWLFILFYSI